MVVLGLGIILQLSVISRFNILNGNGDLILIIICAWASQEKSRYIWLWGMVGGMLSGWISAAPWYLYISVYTIVIGLSRIIIRRVWQAPLLAMFLITFIGSILLYGFTYTYRLLFENMSETFGVVFIEIILPSILINLLLILIITPGIKYISKWVVKEEITG